MTLANIEYSFTKASFPVGDSGPYAMPKSNQGWSVVQIDVDRTPAGGLNSLTSATLITVSFQYQQHPQDPWTLVDEAILQGGQIPQSARLGGGILTTETEGFFPPSNITLPPNTNWQLLVNVAGPSPVVASGTVSWQ